MLKIMSLIGFVALTAACAQPAYVHHAGEFDRNALDFGKDPTDIKNVSICYNSRGSTPAEIRRLAEAECRKFGKSAQFIGQDFSSCPLSTPVSANFLCLGDTAKGSPGKSAEISGSGGRHQVDYDGILFSY